MMGIILNKLYKNNYVNKLYNKHIFIPRTHLQEN